MPGLSFRIFYLGHIYCKKDYLIKTENKQEMFKSPMLSVLFRHPELGNILYDTGNSSAGDAIYAPSMRKLYPVPEVKTIDTALKDVDMTVYDIDRLILSHMHMDHTGGLPLFAGTKAASRGVIISEPDAKDAFFAVNTRTDPGPYIKESICDIPGLSYSAIRQETALADDFILFLQPCHTAGVLGLVIKTEHSGNFIFTSDAVYTEESYNRQLPPGGEINKTESEFHDYLKSLKNLQEQYNGTIIFGHDMGQYSKWGGRWID